MKTSMDDITPVSHMMEAHSKAYDNGGADYSVTEILDCPRIVHLHKRHKHKVQLYVKDQFASFIGTAIHNYAEQMLEQYAKDQGQELYKCENRTQWSFYDRTVSGSYDINYLISNDLYDIKTTKVQTIMRGGKGDWIKQQNIYNLLRYLNEGTVFSNLNIIGVFLNWRKWDYMRYKKESYPPQPIMQYTLPLWPVSETQQWVMDRVEMLKSYEQTPDDDLPLCTHSDMWSEPDKWAVMLKGKARALTAQCLSKKEAWDFIHEHQYNNDTKIQNYTIEYRPSTRIRCEEWCPINPYCSQYYRYNALITKKGA